MVVRRSLITTCDLPSPPPLQLKCCGLDSYEDWGENSYLQREGLRVPESCCTSDALSEDVDACTQDPDSKAELFISCNDALNPFGKEVGIIAIVTVVIMVSHLCVCLLL